MFLAKQFSVRTAHYAYNSVSFPYATPFTNRQLRNKGNVLRLDTSLAAGRSQTALPPFPILPFPVHISPDHTYPCINTKRTSARSGRVTSPVPRIVPVME